MFDEILLKKKEYESTLEIFRRLHSTETKSRDLDDIESSDYEETESDESTLSESYFEREKYLSADHDYYSSANQNLDYYSPENQNLDYYLLTNQNLNYHPSANIDYYSYLDKTLSADEMSLPGDKTDIKSDLKLDKTRLKETTSDLDMSTTESVSSANSVDTDDDQEPSSFSLDEIISPVSMASPASLPCDDENETFLRDSLDLDLTGETVSSIDNRVSDIDLKTIILSPDGGVELLQSEEYLRNIKTPVLINILNELTSGKHDELLPLEGECTDNTLTNSIENEILAKGGELVRLDTPVLSPTPSPLPDSPTPCSTPVCMSPVPSSPSPLLFRSQSECDTHAQHQLIKELRDIKEDLSNLHKTIRLSTSEEFLHVLNEMNMDGNSRDFGRGHSFSLTSIDVGHYLILPTNYRHFNDVLRRQRSKSRDSNTEENIENGPKIEEIAATENEKNEEVFDTDENINKVEKTCDNENNIESVVSKTDSNLTSDICKPLENTDETSLTVSSLQDKEINADIASSDLGEGQVTKTLSVDDISDEKNSTQTESSADKIVHEMTNKDEDLVISTKTDIAQKEIDVCINTSTSSSPIEDELSNEITTTSCSNKTETTPSYQDGEVISGTETSIDNESNSIYMKNYIFDNMQTHEPNDSNNKQKDNINNVNEDKETNLITNDTSISQNNKEESSSSVSSTSSSLAVEKHQVLRETPLNVPVQEQYEINEVIETAQNVINEVKVKPRIVKYVELEICDCGSKQSHKKIVHNETVRAVVEKTDRQTDTSDLLTQQRDNTIYIDDVSVITEVITENHETEVIIEDGLENNVKNVVTDKEKDIVDENISSKIYLKEYIFDNKDTKSTNEVVNVHNALQVEKEEHISLNTKDIIREEDTKLAMDLKDVNINDFNIECPQEKFNEDVLNINKSVSEVDLHSEPYEIELNEIICNPLNKIDLKEKLRTISLQGKEETKHPVVEPLSKVVSEGDIKPITKELDINKTTGLNDDFSKLTKPFFVTPSKVEYVGFEPKSATDKEYSSISSDGDDDVFYTPEITFEDEIRQQFRCMRKETFDNDVREINNAMLRLQMVTNEHDEVADDIYLNQCIREEAGNSRRASPGGTSTGVRKLYRRDIFDNDVKRINEEVRTSLLLDEESQNLFTLLNDSHQELVNVTKNINLIVENRASIPEGLKSDSNSVEMNSRDNMNKEQRKKKITKQYNSKNVYKQRDIKYMLEVLQDEVGIDLSKINSSSFHKVSMNKPTSDAGNKVSDTNVAPSDIKTPDNVIIKTVKSEYTQTLGEDKITQTDNNINNNDTNKNDGTKDDVTKNDDQIDDEEEKDNYCEKESTKSTITILVDNHTRGDYYTNAYGTSCTRLVQENSDVENQSINAKSVEKSESSRSPAGIDSGIDDKEANADSSIEEVIEELLTLSRTPYQRPSLRSTIDTDSMYVEIPKICIRLKSDSDTSSSLRDAYLPPDTNNNTSKNNCNKKGNITVELSSSGMVPQDVSIDPYLSTVQMKDGPPSARRSGEISIEMSSSGSIPTNDDITKYFSFEPFKMKSLGIT